MKAGTTLFCFAVILFSISCGGSNEPEDNGVGGDNGTDTIVARDTNGNDARADVITPEDTAGQDLTSDSRVDGETPEPCRPGESCDDHDPCTINDLCDDNEDCAGTPVDVCSDGIECTFDECTTETECTHNLKPGWCFIDGKCIEEGETDPLMTCRSCQTAIKTDELLPDDTMPCDDGNSCTVSDRCHEGACIADAMNCNDNNPCTADMCKDGQCVHENVEGMCNDDDLCTENDLCVDGQCVGSQIGCWDQNPCTQDACHPDFGCVHEFLDIPCDDGNICSVGDRCWLGSCIPGEGRKDCDDYNQCTDDGCVPTRPDGCVHIPNVAPCDDNDPCTLEDKCKAGTCNPGQGVLDCDDGNLCTNDSCVKGVGCVHENNTVPCDDGEPCSVDDVCGGGACQPGATELVCDDGNECTTDRCEPGVGCVFENNVNLCDDDNVCTVGDVCGDGECIGSPLAGMCDDENECTLDYCLPTGDAPGCYHKARPECRPQIIIDYPERGATLAKVPGDTITVLGHIEYPKPGMIVGFVTVNGLDVMVDPTDDKWTFSTQMTLSQGMNPIVAYGQDVEWGYQDYVVQSAYYSDSWLTVSASNPAAGMTTDGVKIFLGKTVWDDNDTSTPDDIATLVTNILKTLDLSTLIKNPVTSGSFGWCDYKVNVYHIRYGTPTIDLVPDYGKIKVRVVIPKFAADVDVPISGFACPDFDGDVSATSITINADLNLSIDAAGTPVATISNPDVVVSGLNVDIGGIWGFLLNWIVDFFEGNFATMIEDAFEEQLAGDLSNMIQSAVADLALEPEFAVPELLPGMTPVTLQLKSKFSTISVTPDGSDIGLAAVVMPDPAQTAPRTIRGSIGRGACLGTDPGQPTLPHTYEMGLLAKDDFLNEALYSIWASNALKIPVGPEMLGGMDLTEYGIANLALTVEFMLPPIISDCNTDHKMYFEAGDIKISASMKLFGSPVTMTMYASLIAEARIVLVAGETGTEVGIQIETPLFIDIEVAQIDGGLVGAEDTISSLMRTVALPMVLDLLSGDTLASFQLPSIDLSSLAEGFPAGSTIEIDMKEVQRSKGATVVLGNVK